MVRGLCPPLPRNDALYLDPPIAGITDDGQDTLHHAIDLVRLIRSEHGDYFCIAVAGYPEGHFESTSFDDDIGHLKAKVDAGADFVVTQLFYDVDIYKMFLRECDEAGKNDLLLVLFISFYLLWPTVTIKRNQVPHCGRDHAHHVL